MARAVQKKIFVLSGLIVLSLFPALGHAGETLNEKVIKIPMIVRGAFGAARLNLEATIFKPDGDGHFPLLVLSHGSPRGGDAERRSMKRVRYFDQSKEFVRLGFVVVLPMRRGYGRSEGNWAEDYFDCTNPKYFEAGLEGAKDLITVVDFMKRQPFVDGERIVLAGQSAGGFASLAAASIGFQGLIGVINFSGGRGSGLPDFVCNEDLLISAMGKFGKTSHVPTLWHYGENDHYFGPRLVMKMFEAYTHAGGRAKLVMQPPFGKDGHLIFPKPAGIPYWLPEVTNFLKSVLQEREEIGEDLGVRDRKT